MEAPQVPLATQFLIASGCASAGPSLVTAAISPQAATTGFATSTSPSSEDLRGVVRLIRGFATGTIPIARVRAELAGHEEPVPMPGVPNGLLGQMLRFGVVGVMSTIAYFLLYVVLRGVMNAQIANLVAQIVTAVANTAANRAFTFRVHGSRGLLKHHATGLMAFTIALVLTSGSLGALHSLFPGVSTWVEVTVLTAANLVATLVRFLALRFVIGRKSARV